MSQDYLPPYPGHSCLQTIWNYFSLCLTYSAMVCRLHAHTYISRLSREPEAFQGVSMFFCLAVSNANLDTTNKMVLIICLLSQKAMHLGCNSNLGDDLTLSLHHSWLSPNEWILQWTQGKSFWNEQWESLAQAMLTWMGREPAFFGNP